MTEKPDKKLLRLKKMLALILEKYHRYEEAMTCFSEILVK
jgi:hypothetical protein